MAQSAFYVDRYKLATNNRITLFLSDVGTNSKPQRIDYIGSGFENIAISASKPLLGALKKECDNIFGEAPFKEDTVKNALKNIGYTINITY